MLLMEALAKQVWSRYQSWHEDVFDHGYLVVGSQLSGLDQSCSKTRQSRPTTEAAFLFPKAPLANRANAKRLRRKTAFAVVEDRIRTRDIQKVDYGHDY